MRGDKSVTNDEGQAGALITKEILKNSLVLKEIIYFTAHKQEEVGLLVVQKNKLKRELSW